MNKLNKMKVTDKSPLGKYKSKISIKPIKDVKLPKWAEKMNQ